VPTGEHVGTRVQCVYGAAETYEHIRLKENLYTWQCLEGGEKCLAGTDHCHCRRVGDALYLFVWREKVTPPLGASSWSTGARSARTTDCSGTRRLRGALQRAHRLRG